MLKYLLSLLAFIVFASSMFTITNTNNSDSTILASQLSFTPDNIESDTNSDSVLIDIPHCIPDTLPYFYIPKHTSPLVQKVYDTLFKPPRNS